MMRPLLAWGLAVILASFILLLWAILLRFVWNLVIADVLHGPVLEYTVSVIFVGLVAIAIGGLRNW